jgi:hypothetical protein
MIRQLALLVVLAASACQPTGIHLTVRGPGFTIDQLQVTASWSGKTAKQQVPATPTPLSLPTDFFAAFDAQTADVDLLVEGYHGPNRVARGRTAGVHLAPHRVTDAYVDVYGVVTDSAYTRAVLSDAPIAFYRLDEVDGTTVIDSSGNFIHGEYGPMVEHLVAGLTGDGDAAAAFAGVPFSTQAMITVPPNAMLQPSGGVSVELWLQPSAANTHETALVEYGDGPVALSAAYGVRLQSGVLGGLLATSQSQAGISAFRGSTTPAANGRYHCVETYDGASVRLYVDGSVQATQAVTGTLYYTIGQKGLGIGAYADGDAQNGDVVFAGTIDDVAIYATALAPDRISAHFAAATNQ